ncbi:MBL fold metallo-hydrolase [Bacillus massiliglaciei]|uniref:MBL fold metallo-hydrolase n=1 Tax=Bacillus massiliglaciei TaxID=1816693 RepID=UPI000A987229|nr:MBL fold metallo-hydrolase [Bacillus massiliglaciei]
MKKRYENLDGILNQKGFKDLLKWSQERRKKVKDIDTLIPQAERKETERLQSNRSETSITWIGHSTFLIQVQGLNILTDPVWAKRMGAQKRQTEPGLSIQDLPEIDIVVISHGHYDHLDFQSIRKLSGNPYFLVPEGLKHLFKIRGYQQVIESNWWEGFVMEDVKLTFVPAQHWTRRTIFDMNTSHWGGWVIEDLDTGVGIYFAGDTGYFRGFEDIGREFNLDYVLMPIGAYEPEWFMQVSHINPEDAVKAFQELTGSVFIPMHYGAYRLADDTGPEALERLIAEWRRLELDDSALKILQLGETLWCNA